MTDCGFAEISLNRIISQELMKVIEGETTFLFALIILKNQK